MKKILLFSLTCCLTLCVIIISCSKSVKIALDYSVTDTVGNTLLDIYIPDSGTFSWPVWVKFLTGNTDDKVSLSLQGLPADVKMTPDSFSAKPTFIAPFVFYTNHAADASHPVTLVAYTPTTGYKYYKFNLVVVPAVCTKPFIGALTGANSCNVAGKYHYSAIGDTSAWNNIMYIENFGGYGPTVKVQVLLNCDNDSAYIQSGTYANNVTLTGQGIFTANQIILWYNATSTPGGGSDVCVDTFTVAH